MFQSENPFSILGVSVTASSEDVAAAWKAKVKQLHPDRYPDAPEEVLRKLTEEISRVNAAHDLLKRDLEGERRNYVELNVRSDGNSSNSETTSDQHSRPSYQRNVDVSCEICGSLETDHFSFTRQVGLLFQRRVGTFAARLCKNCALALGREYQSRTMTTGWWGTISLFTNFAYIVKNSGELSKAHRLKDPEAPVGFRTSPLDPGLNIAQRPFTWIGPIIIAIAIGAAAANGGGNSSSIGSNYSPPQISSDVYDWAVGNCVSFGARVYPMSCSSVHSGKIVATAFSAQSCPIDTESYVDFGGRTYCIDENL